MEKPDRDFVTTMTKSTCNTHTKQPMTHMRYGLTLLLGLFLLHSTSFASGVYQGPPVDKNIFVPVLTKTIVEGEPMTTNEVLSMEPACLAIGMGRAVGKAWGLPPGVFPQGAELKVSDYPMLYVEGSTTYAQWFHHYCWGELNRLRYFSTSNPEKKSKYLKGWLSAVKYSLDEAKRRSNRWSYLNKVRGDLAAAHLESQKFALAAATAAEVIAVAPEIEATHGTLIDALIALKKRPEAEAAALEALKQFGKKKNLVRRYKALTGKEPDIPDPQLAPVAAPATPSPTATALPVPQQDTPTNKTTTPDHTVAPIVQEVSPPAKVGNETNPYCRFCPVPLPPKP